MITLSAALMPTPTVSARRTIYYTRKSCSQPESLRECENVRLGPRAGVGDTAALSATLAREGAAEPDDSPTTEASAFVPQVYREIIFIRVHLWRWLTHTNPEPLTGMR